MAGFWTVAIAVVLTWRLVDERNQAIDIAQSEAAGAWKKEVAVIRWAADSGTVYVPVTDKTPPDPNLAYLPERDVSTNSGQKLTAISPPMIMDQVHALSRGQSGFKGHIASLKPIRPENSPDPWEKWALEAFARGASEESTEDTIDGHTYFRLMRPLLIDESCMHCHAKQGYKVGDIRGGLTISVPMDPVLEKQKEETVHRILGYGGIWILGLCGIALMSRQLRHQVEHRSQAERKVTGSPRYSRASRGGTNFGIGPGQPTSYKTRLSNANKRNNGCWKASSGSGATSNKGWLAWRFCL